jgi:hypothetical protein
MNRKMPSPEIPVIYPQQIDDTASDRREINSVADALKWEEELRGPLFKYDDRLREIWFRGTSTNLSLAPGMYRGDVTELARDKRWADESACQSQAEDLEERRLGLEREMLQTFERESGPLLQYTFEQELYFVARHHGMPSRLLDWSISPLIALFMCVFPEPTRRRRGNSAQADAEKQSEGVIFAMDPEKLHPQEYIHHQHDPAVKAAIELVTKWNDKDYKNEGKRLILPVRPHTLPGRVDRQMSRFTLHCHRAAARQNSTLRSCSVPSRSKDQIRSQLERIGINEFSVYYTLDRLVSDITDRFFNISTGPTVS